MIHHRDTENTEGTYFFPGRETTFREKMPLKQHSNEGRRQLCKLIRQDLRDL